MPGLKHLKDQPGIFMLALITGFMLGDQVHAGWLQPLDGTGHFRFTCDLVTYSHGNQFEAVAMVSIPHEELTFEKESGAFVAKIRATAVLEGPEGQIVSSESGFRLIARSQSEADSPTLHQIILINLSDIEFQHGELHLKIEDLNRRRPVLSALTSGERASSHLVTSWHAPPARSTSGLSVGGVVYLAHAPIRQWEQSGRRSFGAPGDGPWDYVNPLRRYGLETEALQIYFNLEPPLDAAHLRHAAGRDLRIEITSDHLDFALVDTLQLSPRIRSALAAGQQTAVYWEMDAGGLPPGSYRLGIAPLDTAGRAVLSGFNMVWRLSHLATSTADLLGVGRTVFRGEALKAFELATNADRAVMLADFWNDLDPNPEDPYNEIHAEFHRRIAYVRMFLGGFDELGARDPRGEVYILLGEPDSVLEEPVPMGQQELEDARVLVYERFAPERVGSMVRGRGLEESRHARGNFTTFGAIPMPFSYMADVNIRAKKTAADVRVFQLWRYDQAGDQLFPNMYGQMSGGLRFLFVDRSGRGEFVLDATNTWLRGD